MKGSALGGSALEREGLRTSGGGSSGNPSVGCGEEGGRPKPSDFRPPLSSVDQAQRALLSESLLAIEGN